MTTSIDDLEKEVESLSRLFYSDTVKSGVESVLKRCPNPDSLTTAADRVRCLLVRGKARLLLPAFSTEAETDLNKALKLQSSNPQTWLAMSEAYWKRNALQDAREALEAALRADAKFQPAMTQMSRVLRAASGAGEIPPEERMRLLHESLKMGKESVALNPNDGDAWAAFGMALMQESIALGTDLPMMKKALSAINQASSKSPANPDILYNRGVIHRLLGNFGQAFSDFVAAYKMDSKGLSSAKRLAAEIVEMLTKVRAKMELPRAGIPERDFKKQMQRLPASGPFSPKRGAELQMCSLKEGEELFASRAAAAARVQYVPLKVVDLVSNPNDQPFVYLCIDKAECACVVLLYRVLQSAVKAFDQLFVPLPPSSILMAEHTLQAEALSILPDEQAATSVYRMLTVVVEPNTLLVNGEPIAPQHYKMPQLATRQFQ